MNNQFDDNDYWKGVILYGLNQATYKIALRKALIELTSLNKEVIDWNELSCSLFDNFFVSIIINLKSYVFVLNPDIAQKF